jgi:Cu-Zn family superoxide dismutase
MEPYSHRAVRKSRENRAVAAQSQCFTPEGTVMKIAAIVVLAVLPGAALAQLKVEMNAIDIRGVGAPIGTVTISEAGAQGGVVLKPDLKGLPAGRHGFHVHEFANCAGKEKDGKMSAGELAGGHWDPDKAGKHGSPTGGGHKGDLPPLVVAADGTARQSVSAPRLKLSDLANKALVIHAGPDNFSDDPKPNGGGGDRIACGTIGSAKG